MGTSSPFHFVKSPSLNDDMPYSQTCSEQLCGQKKYQLLSDLHIHPFINIIFFRYHMLITVKDGLSLYIGQHVLESRRAFNDAMCCHQATVV